jgi:hypothetical protein
MYFWEKIMRPLYLSIIGFSVQNDWLVEALG